MQIKSYCTQNEGDCKTCSLVSYGRDCRNVILEDDDKMDPIEEISPGIFLHTCLRCKHTWSSRKEKPDVCSKCKSPYWSIPKGQKMGPKSR